MKQKLYRSEKDRLIAGICGGLGEYLGVDSNAVRLAWIIGTVLTGFIPGTIAYLVAAVVIPQKGE